MVTANLNCKATPVNFSGAHRVALQDSEGEEIIGIASLTDTKHLPARVIEDRGEKLLVVLPKGFSKDAALVNSEILN